MSQDFESAPEMHTMQVREMLSTDLDFYICYSYFPFVISYEPKGSLEPYGLNEVKDLAPLEILRSTQNDNSFYSSLKCLPVNVMKTSSSVAGSGFTSFLKPVLSKSLTSCLGVPILTIFPLSIIAIRSQSFSASSI